MRHYLGLDAGGTKTFCLAGDETGRVLGFGRAATGNYEGFGVDSARTEITKAVNGALETAGLTLKDIAGVGMGVAGADLPDDYVMLDREIFAPLFGEIPRVFRNDSMGGLRGGTRDPFGIVIACGTGCVCAGVNRAGKEGRVGGISEDFGDMVSGSSIGTEGVKAVFRHRDGILPKTLMADLFVARAGCADLDEFFMKMYTRELWHQDLEPMAKLVFDAAFEGDAAACDILEWGGRYLGDMVNAVARQLDMCRDTFDVVMTGSVFKGVSPVLADAMRTRIHRECPGARTVRAEFEPVVGALLLGVELHQQMDGGRYDTLSASLEEAERRFGVCFKPE
ncbi:MAG TPA: BadF/BadG/BcrA/BcrD ATPase family protein [Candidatus Hydrogenedentes bacterium]|nr:BadF/BadG/BcrA/BcrD ATPase family protein [Candidatus Hydrogenedentota bacterium]HOC71518.1 BadF/BadG/BcrA/BcrD ATPase family protein [Candidatus Hydrogenedentota bacterium]